MEFHSILKLSLAIILAIVPAGIWGYMFYKKQVGKKSMLMITFATGALFVTPILLYKYLWQFYPWLDAFQYTERFSEDIIGFSNIVTIPLNIVLSFMFVGIIEEVMKLWAVKMTDRGRICSIDDAIEMSITAALGFAFAENILYFYNIIINRGLDGIFYPFVFRALFSSFAHIMFSGILGYYYGLSLFATDVLKEKANKHRWPFVRVISSLFNLKKESVFHENVQAKGIIIAVTLHAIFNIMLEMNWVFLLVPYLTAGYIYLNHLLGKKEVHKIHAFLGTRRNDRP